MTNKLINFPTGYGKNKRILAMAAATGRKTVIICNRQELRNQWLSIWTDNFKDSLNTLSTVMSVHQFYNIANDAPNKIAESIIVLDIPQGSATEFSKVLSKALANDNEVWIMDVYHGDWKYPLVHNITNINAFEVINELNITEHVMSGSMVPAFKSADCKNFNPEHAAAGAPVICADGQPVKYISPLKQGEKADRYLFIRSQSGLDEFYSTDAIGKFFSVLHEDMHDVLMAPLGYCQGKPVHVGETLRDEKRNITWTLTAGTQQQDFDAIGYTWPRTEPEMPKCNQTVASIHDSYRFLRCKEVDEEIILKCMNYGLAHALTHQRAEIAAYLIACGIVSPLAPRPLEQFSADRLRAVLDNMRVNKIDEFNFQTFTDTVATKEEILAELSLREEPPF